MWASPLPPTRSGVSDYAVELLQELHRLATVRIAAPTDWSPGSDWPFDDELAIVHARAEPGDGEINLVHLGNNPHHEWLLHRLRLPRTVVVLHDLVVHHLMVESTLGRGNNLRFQEHLARSYGESATPLGTARLLGLTGRRDPFLFPARRSFLTGVAGVVVHSNWGLEQVTRDLPDTRVQRIGLAVADPKVVDRRSVRQGLGVPSEAVLLMHLGFLTPEKGLIEILTGVGTAQSSGVDVHVVLVGEGGERTRIDHVVANLGLRHRVTFTGWRPSEDFSRLPGGADLGVVIRTPSAGETSAAALRFLACGTPVAVTGLHQFLEWPESAAPRITPGPSAAADLCRLLQEAARGGDGWRKRMHSARETYEANHRPQDVARQLVDALREIVG